MKLVDIQRPAAVRVKVAPRVTARHPLQKADVLRVAQVAPQLAHRELAVAVGVGKTHHLAAHLGSGGGTATAPARSAAHRAARTLAHARSALVLVVRGRALPAPPLREPANECLVLHEAALLRVERHSETLVVAARETQLRAERRHLATELNFADRALRLRVDALERDANVLENLLLRRGGQLEDMALHFPHQHLAALVARPVDETMVVDGGLRRGRGGAAPPTRCAVAAPRAVERRRRGAAQRAREALAHLVEETLDLNGAQRLLADAHGAHGRQEVATVE